MVREQIWQRGIHSERVLGAMRSVPRHCFVPLQYQEEAYEDYPLPIGYGQTISQPYIVALMTDLLKLRGDEKVLEIGTGSGYQAAVLAQLAGEVHSVETIPGLLTRAAENLAHAGVAGVHLHGGDGSLGWPADAPYQAIVVTAAAPCPPQPLLDQLADPGRLVIPVGGLGGQDLQVWRRRKGKYSFESVTLVAFVPLRGQHGWPGDRWEM